MTTAIQIEDVASATVRAHSSRRYLVQTDASTLYLFYRDSGNGFSYRKSTDAGLTWSSEVDCDSTAASTQVDIYADDWATPTVLHLFFWNDGGLGAQHGGYHRTLTLSTDTLSSVDFATGELGPSAGGGSGGICVAASGRIYLCANGFTGGSTMIYSDNGGASWSVAGASFSEDANEDTCQMWADMESADTNDICAFYWDEDADQLSLKRYDASAGTIAETVIGSLTWTTAASNLASVLMPNGHLYIAAADGANPGTINTWDVYGSTVTARGAVVSAEADCEAAGLMGLSNGYVYCFYSRDGKVRYKVSVDAMVSWGAEATYSTRTSGSEEILLPVRAFNDESLPVAYREGSAYYIETPLVSASTVGQYRLMLAEAASPDVPVLNITPKDIAENGSMLVRVERGRSAVLGNPPQAGRLTVRLENTDLGYNLDQPTPGLAIRLNKKYDDGVTDDWYHMGQANIDIPSQHFGTGGEGFRSVIDIETLGPLSKLAGKKASTALYKSITTGAAIGHLLDACSFPSHLRDLDTGDVTLTYWWMNDGDALAELQKLLNAEGITADLYEQGDGKLVFRSRSARYMETRSSTIQYTLSANVAASPPKLSEFKYEAGWREIVNVARAERIARMDDGSPSVVWTDNQGEGNYIIAPNQTLILEAIGSEPFFDAITPVLNTDYAAGFGTVTVTLERTSGQRTRIYFTAGSGGVLIGPASGNDGIQLRATTTIVVATITEVSGDYVDATASIAAYGVREWTGEMWPEIAWYYMRDNLDAIVSWKQEPRGRITVGVAAHAGDAENEVVAKVEIGDRLRVVEPALDFDGEVWIERIVHEVVAPAGPAEGPEVGHEYSTYECSVISVAVGSQGSGVGADNPYDSIDHGSNVGPSSFSDQGLTTTKTIMAGAGV